MTDRLLECYVSVAIVAVYMEPKHSNNHAVMWYKIDGLSKMNAYLRELSGEGFNCRLSILNSCRPQYIAPDFVVKI